MKWEVGDVAEIVNITSHPVVNGMECEIRALTCVEPKLEFTIYVPQYISGGYEGTWDIHSKNLKKLPPANTKTFWEDGIFKPKILETV